MVFRNGVIVMDFNKARTFVEVVDRGGITAAASHLRRTQQAISMQINNLESDLGLSLLVRQGPNIVLTADGEELYQLFKEHLVVIEGRVQHLQTDKTKVSGVIRVGTWLELSVGYLPELIRGFSEIHPLVTFEIFIARDNGLEAMLTANKIDISYQLYVENQRIFKKTPALREILLPVVSREYITKYGLPKTVEDTLDMPLVDYHPGYSTYNPWIKKNRPDLLSAAQNKPRFIEVSNNTVLKQLLLQGLGMGFLCKSTIQEELSSGKLIPLSFPNLNNSSWAEFDIVYKRKHSLGFVHQEFIKYALETRTALEIP